MTERLHFHFPALEKEMAAHSTVLAWRIPGMGEPGGLPSMGSRIVGHDWKQLSSSSSVSCWFFVCLAMPCDIWNLSSLIRDPIYTSCTGSSESWPPDHQESPLVLLLMWIFLMNTDGNHLSMYCLLCCFKLVIFLFMSSVFLIFIFLSLNLLSPYCART